MVLILTKLDIGEIVITGNRSLRKISVSGLKSIPVKDYELVPFIISDWTGLMSMDINEQAIQIRRDLTDYNLARNIRMRNEKNKPLTDERKN